MLKEKLQTSCIFDLNIIHIDIKWLSQIIIKKLYYFLTYVQKKAKKERVNLFETRVDSDGVLIRQRN